MSNRIHAAFATALLMFAASAPANAQSTAPNISGSYRCEPEPTSCEWSGKTFTVTQSGMDFELKNDKGDVGRGSLKSNISLGIGAPWNMLGVIQPDHSIEWSNGTKWLKQ